MLHSQPSFEPSDVHVQQSGSRRAFFTRFAAVAAAGVVAGPALAQSTPSPTPTPTPIYTDGDIFNFLLNLELLKANYYAFAVAGAALKAADIGGSIGVAGSATGGRAVAFRDPIVAQYAREIAADELTHVRFLRSQLNDLTRISQPAIDLGSGPTNAFSLAAQAAGLTPPGGSFDPYASDENFLLGAFLIEDVGVAALKNAAATVNAYNGEDDNRSLVEPLAGIMAVDAYHAGIIRTLLYRRGLAAPALRLVEATTALSDARDRFDGAPATDALRGVGPDDDQGLASGRTADGDVSNIAPSNESGLTFSRSPVQTLNIVYLNAASVSKGGFFPAGVNGTIKTSAASA